MTLRSIAAAVAVMALLDAACTEERLGPRADGSPAPGKRRCEQIPGTVPDEFILTGTDDVEHDDHIGVRFTYEASDRRLLSYLVGIVGDVGEGAPFLGEREIFDGTRARLLGERRTWFLVWELAPPCRQIAIIGDRMGRGEFLDLMRRSAVLAGSTSLTGVTAWVAVFRTARDSNELNADTQELIEKVGTAILVSPVGCLGGLEEELDAPSDSYVLGVIAETEDELSEVVEKAGRVPIFVGEVEDLCPV